MSTEPSIPLTCVLLIGILFAIPGIITGIIALVKISKKPAIYGGKGMAIGGIATSAVTFLFIPIIAAIAIPNLLQARKSANEAMTIGRMRQIASAEIKYAESNNRYGTIQELVAANLLDPSENGDIRGGYKLTLRLPDEKSYEVIAMPETSSSGGKSYYLSEDGAIHSTTAKDREPNVDDPPLGSAPRQR